VKAQVKIRDRQCGLLYGWHRGRRVRDKASQADFFFSFFQSKLLPYRAAGCRSLFYN
jgi:hypothetical protein